MSKLPLAFLLVSLLSLPFCVISQSRAATELATLLRVRRDWGDPPALRSWNSSSSSACGWEGIECSGGGTVTGIVLREMNITAGIPPAVFELEDLTELDLAWNFIPGVFPKFLYNCSKLRVLDLSQNVFVGQIPDDIDRLPSSLDYLDLGGNNFTGDVPAAIGRISSLRTLNLYKNEFNGTFPKEIGDLINLENLSLAYNWKFSPRTIPEEFGRLKNLKLLWMTDCNLVGEIPESFNNLSSLEHLDLSLNTIAGRIPSGLFMQRNLSYVYLYNNELSGQIPSSVASMGLIEIDLSSNNLTGPVPEDFGKLDQLEVLNLFENQFYGEIPVGIGRIPSLRIFRVFSNGFVGALPPDFGLNSPLEEFEVSENRFTGHLPENLCVNGKLQGVVAFSNNLGGGIPRSLSGCDSLHTVQLYRNIFSGEFPVDIWALLNLSSLMIGRNSFSGSIPSKLAENLSRVDISDNRFSGELPGDFSSWSAMTVFLASNNLISGTIPGGLTGLANIITLSLDGNRISGELPPVIGSWQSLVSLNLSGNDLSGQIPAAIGRLPHLLDLDLSDNGFSGPIPPQLSDPKFTLLNLSSNRLSGKIPSAFESAAYETSFLNNSDLCSNSGTVNIRRCYGQNGGSRRKMSLSSKYLAVILSLAVAVGVFAFLIAIFILRAYRRKQLDRDFETWKIKSFEKLDFTEANVLYNLTDDNLIGSGGSGKVYQVSINGGGDHVAVKKISSCGGYPDPKGEREFLAEVETLGTMRHRNIVKLLCCISSENSKLLVYEYMENQSLDRWLHGMKAKGALDWPKRLKIGIGAAQGLCYMHHDCSPPVIHRDVKSSNILLDFEFKAKVADFGLAKILRDHGDPHGVSTVAGSFGYFAPESAYATKVNEKIDVYSFGVVLLELVTGREAHNGDEDTSLADWAWRHYVEGKQIADAIDETIRMARCHSEEMSTVFKLGLACTSRSPATRPTMKDVLHVLQKCSPKEGFGCENKLGTEFDVIPLLGSTTYLSSYKPKTQFQKKGNDSFAYSYSV